MKVWFLIGFFLRLTINSAAQPVFWPGPADGTGIHFTSISDSGLYSIYVNPAHLNKSSHHNIQLHQHLPFTQKELACSQLEWNLFRKNTAYGLGLSHWGFARFGYTDFAFSIALRLSKNLLTAIVCHSQLLQAAEYGNQVLIYPDISWHYHVSNGCQLDAIIRNALFIKDANDSIRTQSIFSGTLPISHYVQFAGAAIIQHLPTIDSELAFRYQINDRLKAILSWRIQSSVLGLSCRVNTHSIQICMSAAIFQQPLISPSCSLLLP